MIRQRRIRRVFAIVAAIWASDVTLKLNEHTIFQLLEHNVIKNNNALERGAINFFNVM